MSDGFLRTLLLAIIAINGLNFVINILGSGTIPLFSEAGGAGRFDATTNSRLLTWLFLATQGYAAIIYAISTTPKIRKLALWCFGFDCLSSLLFASKGAILQPILLLLFSAFVAACRQDTEATQRLSRLLKKALAILVLLAPAYLAAVLRSSDSGSVVARIGIRMLGGFDQLIPAALYNMAANDSPNRDIDLNLLQYQLLPFFKAISGIQPDYSSIGQYVVELWSGKAIEGPFTFPNSNLILETIFTSGYSVGYLLYFSQLLCFYIGRYLTLAGNVTVFRLVLMKMVVYSPFGLFLSGQEFMSNFVVVCGVTFACYAVWKLIGEPPAAVTRTALLTRRSDNL